MVTTAGGQVLAKGGTLGLNARELAPVLTEFEALPEGQRKPTLEDPVDAIPAKRPVPDPPVNGLIIRGYCTYLSQAPDGAIARKPQLYYKQNPDAWAAETQNDMLWLTEAEWKSLLPTDPTPGATFPVPAGIQDRFLSTIGIDYMEGSVNALPVQGSDLLITIDEVEPARLTMSLSGTGQMGVPLPAHDKSAKHSRGCALRVAGRLEIDRKRGKFTRFDLVGIGKAWGNKMEYTKREIGIEEYPWTYGIACELVTGTAPADLLVPYNLVHYGSGLPYFPKP